MADGTKGAGERARGLRATTWALLLLLAANALLGAAWLYRDALASIGWLAAPPAERIDLSKGSLPTAADAPADPREGGTEATMDDGAGAAEEPAVLDCIAAGPFQTRPDADAVAVRLRGLGASAEVATVAIAAPEYLVYVQPAPHQDGAQRIYEELRDQGFDAYVIPSGRHKHGVSVGQFPARDLAASQERRVGALGYAVRTHALQRTATAYRVRARDVPEEALTALPARRCEEGA